MLPRFPVSSSNRCFWFNLCRRTFARNMKTADAPVCPKFISVEGNDISSRSKPDGFRFHVVSYNILAQVYVESSMFPHSPEPALMWESRSQAILTVLKNLGADILCLQELDEYYDFYKENMETHGYSSIYNQRNGNKRDGCGIFYKPDIAEVILEEKIDYNDLLYLFKDRRTSRARLERDCVGILAAFRLADPSHHIVIVANTHLYWKKKFATIKLAQAKYLLSRLAQFKTLVSDKFECSPSVIVAGDFNSTPGDKVYEYLMSAKNAEYLEELPIPPLSSVYASTRGSEPAFTICKPNFTNTLDYIFYSPSDDMIKPVSILQLPDQLKDSSTSTIVGGLPNYYHPSDHLPIGAQFEVSSSQ